MTDQTLRNLEDLGAVPKSIDLIFPSPAIQKELLLKTAAEPLSASIIRGYMTELELFDRVQRDKHRDTRKETTAQQVLDLLGIDNFGEMFDFEVPERVLQEAFMQVSRSFDQDYWSHIIETTRRDMQSVLTESVTQGFSIRRTAQTFARHFGDEYDLKRSTLVARTEIPDALNKGHDMGIRQLNRDVPELEIGKEWLSVFSRFSRASHMALDGTIVPAEQSFDLNGILCTHPASFVLPAKDRCNCVPADSVVCGDMVRIQRAWYEGPMREIVFRSGRSLKITPNHPVLTEHGFVAAGQVDVGDKMINAQRDIDRTHGMRPFSDHVDHKPIQVAQLFHLITLVSDAVSSVHEVRSSSVVDFYGDGKFVKGDVDDINVNALLERMFNIVGFQKRTDFAFASMLDELLRLVSGNYCITGINTAASHVLSEFCRTLPLSTLPVISVDPLVRLTVGGGTDFDAKFIEACRDDASTEPILLRQLGDRHSFDVSFDDIVDVRNYDFCGHVFDLSSTDGTFVCNDYIVSNCLCTILSSFITNELGISGQDAENTDASTQEQPKELMDELKTNDKLAKLHGAVMKAPYKTAAKEAHDALKKMYSSHIDELLVAQKTRGQEEQRRVLYARYLELKKDVEAAEKAVIKERAANAKITTKALAGDVEPIRFDTIHGNGSRLRNVNTNVTKKTQKKIAEAEEFVSSITDKKLYGKAQAKTRWYQLRTGQRAHHKGSVERWSDLDADPDKANAWTGMYLDADDGIDTAVHELCHSVEARSPKIKKLTNEFVQKRIARAGTQKVSMRAQYPSHGYKASEFGNEDDFGKLWPDPNDSAKHYAGKTYSSGHTEILTLGVELLYTDAAGFAARDPEYFKFIVGVLNGTL